ncbi:hypothetical protein G9A89_021082 [Geosiphon pyriformis]|nr:hypothetical protein G9A89_021082 [Geosiphon pyriformis]
MSMKTTTRREKIGSKMDKYLLESIIAVILLPSSIIKKTLQEILLIDKNLSYKRQLKLYGHFSKIIEDMKLIKKTTSEIQAEILNIIQLDVPRVLTIAKRAKTLIQRFVKKILCWNSLDSVKTSIVQKIVNSNVGFNQVHLAFFSVQKTYCVSKLAKFLQAEELRIKLAIDKWMENFVVNKGNIIRNVLECLFRKMVLDYLVVEDELILKSDLVKTKINVIIESWTKKHSVVKNFSGDWSHQYQPLEYVFNDAFLNVMCSVSFDKLFGVIFNLPNGKAAGFSRVSNKL